MSRAGILALLGVVLAMLPSGCVRKTASAVTDQPLASGEVIRLVSSSLPIGEPEFVIRSDGCIQETLPFPVHVAGLTPAEARVAIRNKFVPQIFTNWDFNVIRVQPKD